MHFSLLKKIRLVQIDEIFLQKTYSGSVHAASIIYINFDENFYMIMYENFSIDVTYKCNNYHIPNSSSVHGKGLLYYVSCNMALTLILPCDHLRVCC